MAKKGCTYSRSPKGQCRSAVAHYKHSQGSGKRKGVCSYGRRKGKCMSKKASAARKRSAARKIQRSFRRMRK
jgi:hypothetical protein